MLLTGDECGRTQKGNNNAYCHDNDITWVDWKNADAGLFKFTRSLIRLRRIHPAFRRRMWFRGHPASTDHLNDIAWFTPDGQEMQPVHWGDVHVKALACLSKVLDTTNALAH